MTALRAEGCGRLSAAGCVTLRSGGDSGFAAEGGGGALRAQIIKKPARALRHFDRSGAERNGVEKSPPPMVRAALRQELFRFRVSSERFASTPIPAHSPARDDDAGGRHWTHLRREGSEGAVPHSDCPTVCGAERWWRQPPKGENTEMVPEVYDSLFFPSYLSFPLEGKSREAGKGVRGRAPIGGSIAVLTANRRPPERSDARNVVSRFPFRAIRHRIRIS